VSISYVGAGALQNASATPLTMPLPAGHTTNDILVAMGFVRSVGSWGTPSGYTTVNASTSSSVRKYLYAKIDGGSESNPSSVLTSVDGTHRAFGIAIGLRGCVNDTIANALEGGAGAVSNAVDAVPTSPAITITTPGCIVVTGYGMQSTATAVDWPSIGYTQIDFLSTATGGNWHCSFGYQIQTAATSITGLVYPVSGQSSASWGSSIAVFKPDVSVNAIRLMMMGVG
jgi:hypothetical protein